MRPRHVLVERCALDAAAVEPSGVGVGVTSAACYKLSSAESGATYMLWFASAAEAEQLCGAFGAARKQWRQAASKAEKRRRQSGLVEAAQQLEQLRSEMASRRGCT